MGEDEDTWKVGRVGEEEDNVGKTGAGAGG